MHSADYKLDRNVLIVSAVIVPHRTWSTLALLMAWCLTAPSHYLNQCWLIIKGVIGHSPKSEHFDNFGNSMYRWLSARLHYRHCYTTGDTAVLHWAINICHLAYIIRMVADVLVSFGTRPSATTMLTWWKLKCHMNDITQHTYGISVNKQLCSRKVRKLGIHLFLY